METSDRYRLDAPWALDPDRAARRLDVDPSRGLHEAEADARRERVGPNRLERHHRRGAWAILADQFRSLVIGLLALAAVVAAAWGEWMEAGAIAIVLAINAAIGFLTELRAIRSMEALRELGTVRTRVRRGGEERAVDAELLVPGDIVRVEAGDIVTADLRVIEASKLQADESALTGESLPVGKESAAVDADTELAERASMLYRGTAVTRGSGTGLVVATGMDTELGQVSRLVEEAESAATPLEERLDRLGRRLIFLTLAIAAATVGAGILSGKNAFLMIETGIALAVAAVPEGLPIVATIALARGMRRMARRNALINRLSSVETLGATDVICVDKTGTLTENRMTATRLVTAGGDVEITGEGVDTGGGFRADGRVVDASEDFLLREALEIGALCNNASLPEDPASEASGDPMEVALLVAAAKAGIQRGTLVAGAPEVRQVAFEVDVKMMATFHRSGDGMRVAVKGAPSAVLEASDRVLGPEGTRPLDEDTLREWRERNERMADEGLRILALATREAEEPEEEPYGRLVLVGLVGFRDPPRAGVGEAIASCRRAGIRVVMLTGDQPATARGIARAVGLVDRGDAPVLHGRELDAGTVPAQRREEAAIFARVTPRHKLDLIEGYQRAGHVVAMTGDGVNDAPALRRADIGVAMGGGTEVARQAADLVLVDDNLATAAVAVAEGRRIYDNIRRFLRYALAGGLAEILVMLLGPFAGLAVPLLPAQILWVNLLTHGLPGVALGAEPAEPDTMRRAPRSPQESIIGGGLLRDVLLTGTLIAAAVLGAGVAGYRLGLPWQSVVFVVLGLAQLGVALAVRAPRPRGGRGNPALLAAVAGSAALQVAGVLVPALRELLGTEWLTGTELIGCATVAALPGLVLALGRWRRRRPVTG